MIKIKVIVDNVRCVENHVCPARTVCPVDAIRQKGYRAPTIDQGKCIKCKKCIDYCPMGAIQVSE